MSGGGPLWGALDQYCELSCYEVIEKLEWNHEEKTYARAAAHAHSRGRFTDMISFLAWFQARTLPRPCTLWIHAAFGTEPWMYKKDDNTEMTPQQLALLAVHMLHATLFQNPDSSDAWEQWAALPEIVDLHERILHVLWTATRATEHATAADAVHKDRGLSYRATAEAFVQMIGVDAAVTAVRAVSGARRRAALARQVAVRLLRLPPQKTRAAR